MFWPEGVALHFSLYIWFSLTFRGRQTCITKKFRAKRNLTRPMFFLCVDIVGAKGWNKPMEVKDKRR
jgi:hypothetical protein